MCAKISAAVRELTPTYADKAKLDVQIGTTQETEKRWKKYVKDKDNHGLLGLTPTGDVAFTLPGHKYGKDEVVKAIDTMLAE